jgi:HD-GYP domain-containing protein (c-di-GMP phosphodiesterase class II)
MMPDHFGENDRLREFVAELARKVGLDADHRQALDVAATLLGVGRLPVVDIMTKKGTLAPEEIARIRDIPAIWADFAGQLSPLRDLGVPDILEAYCESWDGSGYPKGLAGKAIPLGARILAVCYHYSGMVSDRPYRSRLPHGRAADELRRMSGGMLDPTLVERFIEMVEEKRETARMIAKRIAEKESPEIVATSPAAKTAARKKPVPAKKTRGKSAAKKAVRKPKAAKKRKTKAAGKGKARKKRI